MTHTRSRWVISLLASLLLLTACRKEKEEEQPTEPWPAPAAQSAEEPPSAPSTNEGEAPSGPRTSYRFVEGSLLQVSLPAKEAKPTGTFRIVRGTLEVDLVDLQRTRGTLEVDLGSVLMDAPKHEAERDYTTQARQWLNLGASRTDSELERARFARFVIGSIDGLSHPAPHLGRRLPPERAAQDAPEANEGERRRVTGTAHGELELNGLRVRRSASVVVDFHYPAKATAGFPPTRITVSSARPVSVPLAEHEIQPRDAHGRLLSAELDRLGRVVGRTALVTFQLAAVP